MKFTFNQEAQPVQLNLNFDADDSSKILDLGSQSNQRPRFSVVEGGRSLVADPLPLASSYHSHVDPRRVTEWIQKKASQLGW